MIEAKHLLVDTNVWLDYYLQEGAFDEAKRLVELAEAGKIDLLYAPTTAKDVFYILPRRLARRNVNGINVSFASASWACIEHMMQVATASPLSLAECEMARMLGKHMSDLEDNLIIASGETADVDYVVTSDRRMLEAMPEVQKVTPLNDGQLERLLKPWLGDDVDLSNLPMPRLIDVKLKKDAEINFMALAEKLATVAPQASLDNHKLWLNKLINFASGLKMLALSVLALVIGITSGAIFYSTQTSLGLHKDIIEILHLLGAKDTYIAQQYAAKTAVLGFWGGLIGVVFAVPTIFVIAHLAQQIEGGIINEARLSWGAWTVIFSLPLFSMLVAMQTAYYTVKRTLEKMM